MNLRFSFSFFFFLSLMFLWVFLAYFGPIFWSNREPDANESKKRKGSSKTQTNGEKTGAGEGMGARCRRAGFRRDSETCTSDSGTDVCTTLPPRYDNVMTDASGKGVSERDDATVITKPKPKLNGFRGRQLRL